MSTQQFSTAKPLFLPAICLLIILQLLQSSCMGPKKLDKWISKHYDETVPVVKQPAHSYVSFVMNDSVPAGKVSTTEKTHSSLVPALLYWQWNHTMLASVNTGLIQNAFLKEFTSYANSKGLKEKLNGNTLELTINSNPANFVYTQKGHLIFLLLYYISYESIYIAPAKDRLSFSYKVMNNAQEVKSGKIGIKSPNKEVAQQFFKSNKKMTWQYLTDCDNNIKDICQELVNQLLYEL